VNHHHKVPFHLLKDVPDLSVGDPGSGNLIVQGDNLVALKALLPYYAGQVKCISSQFARRLSLRCGVILGLSKNLCWLKLPSHARPARNAG